MCIIAIKPAGIELPKEKVISTMWKNNSDGAGLMYVANGTVIIEKGFMSLTEVMDAIENLKNKINIKKTPVIFHFRIGTSGGNVPENTHPFPVDEDLSTLQQLWSQTSLGVVHNGMIDILPRKGISDTMEYIISQLGPLYQLRPDFYKHPLGKKIVKNAIKSKMAFLDRKGRIETIGCFEKGPGELLYSNSSYSNIRWNWDWDWDWEKWIDRSRLKSKKLSWLNPNKGIVVFKDGSTDLADFYLTDKHGNVYDYNFYTSTASLVDAVFCDKKTNLPREGFDENNAEIIEVEG